MPSDEGRANVTVTMALTTRQGRRFVKATVWATPAGGRYGSQAVVEVPVPWGTTADHPEDLIAAAIAALSEAAYGS